MRNHEAAINWTGHIEIFHCFQVFSFFCCIYRSWTKITENRKICQSRSEAQSVRALGAKLIWNHSENLELLGIFQCGYGTVEKSVCSCPFCSVLPLCEPYPYPLCSWEKYVVESRLRSRMTLRNRSILETCDGMRKFPRTAKRIRLRKMLLRKNQRKWVFSQQV